MAFLHLDESWELRRIPIHTINPFNKDQHPTVSPSFGGQEGIEHVVHCLLAETDLIMAIDGYPSVADLTPNALRRLL